MNWDSLKTAFSKAFQNNTTTAIVGSGTLVTDTLKVHDFDRIVAEGGFTLNATQSGTESVTVTTDDNIRPHLTIEVVDRTLYLKPKEDGTLRPTTLIYEVYCTALNHVILNGSATGNLAHLSATSLTLQSNGSGRLSCQGHVETLSLDINGSGSWDAGELVAHSATISIAGAGDVSVHATHQLSISIAGAGSVTYVGDPAVHKSIMGTGSVKRA
jgi:hypothetical protein